MPKPIETVPNQRVLTIHKEPTDKQHKYTLNNLEAMGEAARRLQSKAGFKLYMYLAKNQPTEVTKREWVHKAQFACKNAKVSGSNGSVSAQFFYLIFFKGVSRKEAC